MTPQDASPATCVTGSSYTTRYIRNRLSQATVTPPGGSALTPRTGALNHDDTNYGTSFTCRGNLTCRASVGDSGSTPSQDTSDSLTVVLTPGGNRNLTTETPEPRTNRAPANNPATPEPKLRLSATPSTSLFARENKKSANTGCEAIWSVVSDNAIAAKPPKMASKQATNPISPPSPSPTAPVNLRHRPALLPISTPRRRRERVKLEIPRHTSLSRFALTALMLAALPLAAAPAETGQLDASQSLFTVMAAINAVGYRADWSSQANHPLRHAIEAEIAKNNPPSLVPLKEFFDKHRKKNDALEISQYISFALSCSGPPEFDFGQRDVEIPPDVAGMRELSKLLATFYKEAAIESLWNRSQPAIDQYLERYHEPVTNAVLQVNGYMRQMTSGFKRRHFQIFVELQGQPNQIQTRSYSDNYTIVVTPSAEPRIFDIRHGYLHYLLDPMATRDQEILNRKKSLVDHALRSQALSDSYKEDYLLLVTESLIKAVESRLDRKPGVIQEALKDGYILAPYFAEALPVYEKQESSMLLYYKEMVQAIDVVKEDKRLTSVEFNKTGAERPPLKTAPAPPPPVTGAAKTLQDAEEAYGSRQLATAKQLFLKALEQTDKLPQHASAYYGLGRIALLEKNLDDAERMFLKSLECEPEGFDKAWDMVYLGRLAVAEGDREKAIRLLQGVAKVEGATDKAKEQAAQLLQQISKQ